LQLARNWHRLGEKVFCFQSSPFNKRIVLFQGHPF
jgi:hypothetical protein